MDKERIKRKEKKTVNVTIKIRPSLSKWLKSKQYGPTAIFEEACADLGYKGAEQ